MTKKSQSSTLFNPNKNRYLIMKILNECTQLISYNKSDNNQISVYNLQKRAAVNSQYEQG